MVHHQHAAWETLAEGAGGFVSILDDARWVRAEVEDRRSMATRSRRRMRSRMMMMMMSGGVGSGGRGEERGGEVRSES